MSTDREQKYKTLDGWGMWGVQTKINKKNMKV